MSDFVAGADTVAESRALRRSSRVRHDQRVVAAVLLGTLYVLPPISDTVAKWVGVQCIWRLRRAEVGKSRTGPKSVPVPGAAAERALSPAPVCFDCFNHPAGRRLWA